MSYNTHAGSDRHRRLDLDAIARTIERADPDVVALQEVDRHYGPRSRYQDQPAWYAERLGMQVHFAANLRVPAPRADAPEGEYGLALLSRLPMHRTDHRPYEFVLGEPRGLVSAMIDWNGTTVRVINTHLSVSHATNRRAETAELLDVVAAANGPTVVAGDFNARPRATELRTLRHHLTDAWRAGRGCGTTCTARRIDYVWVSPPLQPIRSWVGRSRASDHRPVITDLVLAP